MRLPADLVVVSWYDAYIENDRGGTIEEVLENAPSMLRHTCGWQVGQTDRDVIIAMDYDEHREIPHYQTIVQIPIVMVVAITPCSAKRVRNAKAVT